MISVTNYGENKIYIFHAVRFHENGGHLGFYGIHKGIYNPSSNPLKSCTHIEDIYMEKRTQVFLVLLNNTF